MTQGASSLDEEYERDDVSTILEHCSNNSHKVQESKTQFLFPDVSTQVPNQNDNSSMNSSFLHNPTHKFLLLFNEERKK